MVVRLAERRARRTCGPALRSIGPRNEENGKEVEKKHQAEIRFGLAVGAVKFLPGEDTPERSDHWRRLPDCVGNRDPREPCGNQIKNRAQAPNAAPQKSEEMTLRRSAKKISEMNRVADKRFFMK